jgi:sec-independent protein translocase protein TatA
VGIGALELPHLLVILVIVLLVFGVGRVGELGGELGKAMREFKKATQYDPTTDKDEAKKEAKSDSDKPAA